MYLLVAHPGNSVISGCSVTRVSPSSVLLLGQAIISGFGSECLNYGVAENEEVGTWSAAIIWGGGEGIRSGLPNLWTILGVCGSLEDGRQT
jgi:hypothetical protein